MEGVGEFNQKMHFHSTCWMWLRASSTSEANLFTPFWRLSISVDFSRNKIFQIWTADFGWNSLPPQSEEVYGQALCTNQVGSLTSSHIIHWLSISVFFNHNAKITTTKLTGIILQKQDLPPQKMGENALKNISSYQQWNSFFCIKLCVKLTRCAWSF